MAEEIVYAKEIKFENNSASSTTVGYHINDTACSDMDIYFESSGGDWLIPELSSDNKLKISVTE